MVEEKSVHIPAWSHNWILGLFVALLAVSAVAEDRWIAGRVVGVHDGDSLTLLVEGNQQLKVRLESIDAPELGQEYGKNAKAALGELAFGKTVQVYVTGTDKYKRTLGWVFVDQLNVNLEMVKRGMAWNYVEYSNSQELARAEVDARNRKAGLWRDWKPMAPWDWRALQKRNAATKSGNGSATVAPFTEPPSTQTQEKEPATMFWLNTSSNKRHNSRCRYFGNTKRGRYCSSDDGRACGTCGG